MLPLVLNRRRVIGAIGFAAGLVLLVWQIRSIGTAEIARGMALVGWLGAAAIVVLSFIRFYLRAYAWVVLLGGSVPVGRALRAFVAGDAAGNLTPLGLLASEPAKVMLIDAPGGPTRTLAALTLENFFFGVSVVLYLIAGAAAMLSAFDVDPVLRTSGLIVLGVMTATLVLATFVAWRRPAILGWLVSRLTDDRWNAVVEHARAFEGAVYTGAGGRVTTVLVAAGAFHVLSFLETWLTLWLITGASDPLRAFILDTVSRMANVLFKMIPMQLGVLQIGSELVGRAVGLAPGVGTTISLVRTVRMLFWAGVGVTGLAKK